MPLSNRNPMVCGASDEPWCNHEEKGIAYAILHLSRRVTGVSCRLLRG